MTIRASIVRVFLSSPGDVSEERRLLRNVLDRIPRDPLLRERVYLDTVAYDDPDAQTPMAANESPQQSVNRYKPIPSECDLTVVILWSRFGTTLPLDQLKPDGSRYASGTEWEYEDALRAGKTVWVYYRRSQPIIDPSDPNREEKVKQRQAVERFISGFTNPDGSFARGYNVYDSPEHLSVLFEQHLKSYLRERLDGGPRHEATMFRMGQLSFPNSSPDLDKYYIDFARELDAGRELVGRTEIFEQLAEFEATHSRGYFQLIADAGLGKTTFAAAVALRRNAAAFFANASRGLTGADQCMNHLCATLIARFDLAHDDLPPNSGDSNAFFETVLSEAMAKSNGPLWLVVDGLDEADEAMGRNVLLLPQSLPNGAYCLLTQAPGDYPLLILPDTPLGRFELRSDSPLQQTDVDDYLKSQLAHGKITKRLETRRSEIKGSVRDLLREASQGNFRFLSYVLTDLASGELTFDLSTLPQGLLKYYGATWARMEASAEVQGGKELKRLYRKVVGLLAVAREPVTLGWLAELSGQESIDIQDEVLTTWRRFLSKERRGKIELWRFPDRSFGDFLVEKLLLTEQHASIAAYYRPQPAWRKHDGYASRNLTTHLRSGEDMDGLASLVDDMAWCQSQLLIDPAGAAYQNDLMQACVGAFTNDKGELEDDRPMRWLSREVLWSFTAASLRGYWFNVWPVMLADFVSARILSEGQVVAWAAQIPKEFDRGRSLAILAPVLSSAFRRKAIDAIRTIEDEDTRVHSLLEFASEVEGEERASLIAEALSIAWNMPNDWAAKVAALTHVAELSDPQSEERQLILQEAAEIANSLEDGDERARALLTVLPLSLERIELLGKALGAIRSLEDPSQAIEDIENTFGVLPEAVGVELARVMIEVRERIPTLEGQIEWLKSTLSGLTGAERSQLFLKIRALVESLPDPENRANWLLNLGDLASESERIDLYNKAEEGMGLMPDGPRRSVQLCKLAARLSGARASQLWRESVARLIEQSGAIATAEAVVDLTTRLPERSKQVSLALAEDVVRSLPDSMPKARLFIELAQASDEDMSRRLVLEAARIPGGVLAAGVQTPDEVELLELVAALGARLTPTSRELLVQRAERVANGLADHYARGCALAALLPISGAEQRRQIVDSVLAAAAGVRNADERTELLLAVLPEINASEREVVIEEAVAAAREIVPGEIFSRVDVNNKTLVATAHRIPDLRGCPSRALLRIAMHADGKRKKELVDEAYDLVFDHPPAWQAEALAELAPHLSMDVSIATIAAVRALLQDSQRETLRSVLQERAAQLDSTDPLSSQQTDEPETNEEGEEEEGQVIYDVRYPDLWFRLDRDGLSPVISDSPGSEGDAGVRANQLSQSAVRGIGGAVVSGLSREDLAQANYVVHAAIREWHAAMGKLLTRLADLASSDAALKEARATWPDVAPPAICASLLPLVADEEKKRLLDDAITGSDALQAAERAQLWLAIYPYLQGKGRETVVERLRESLQRVEAPALAELATTTYSKVPEFSCVDLRGIVHRVLHSIDERRYLALPIRQMIPMMEALAGAEDLSAIAEGILEIRERWI